MNTQEVWNEFHQDLSSFIKRRISNPFDAEDLLQEVFRKIHDSIDRMDDESKIHSWVYRITRNTITDFYRSHAKKKSAEIQLELEAGLDFPTQLEVENNLNPLVSQWLNCIVQSLDDKYREAILLTEFGNITQKELAEKLGLSISGAKSRVQRARVKLKELLLACCHIELDRLGNVIDYRVQSESCNCRVCQN
ncbi:RNA polymerase sigma factor SigZ [Cohnella sp.]|uniref:RNA polymerase sigma factor SigZ n=1 Tax=Cohnella sp. TaxID=1883426 RepID=UPI0035625627